MIKSIEDFRRPFFIGIAGVGMSAIAQYLHSIGKEVSGSDRFFLQGVHNEMKDKLESEGIPCFVQDGEGITPETDLIVVSSAIEDTVAEVQKAKQLNLPIIKRAELLSVIASSKKTIAVGGTSGKSTTTAMLFTILEHAGYDPGIISGAGLIRLIKEGRIGNARAGTGEWLVIEADESDGSIVEYKPEIGVLLNIDRDHQEIEELIRIFGVFRNNSRYFCVNQSHPLTKSFSEDWKNDFSTDTAHNAGYVASGFAQQGLAFTFLINGAPPLFRVNLPGKHNMENAVAACAVANGIGIPLETCAKALLLYDGIYRRHQVYGEKKGVWLIDDYAHNPVKCAAAIAACQPIASKVIAWFQPHGYKPTKFLRDDFVKELAGVLRADDEIWMSEIFYVGGTTNKDISANDLINDLKALGKNAFFVENRNDFLGSARSHFTNDTVLLLMAARDPSVEQFANETWEKL